MIRFFVLDKNQNVEFCYLCKDFDEIRSRMSDFLAYHERYYWIDAFYEKEGYYKKPLKITTPEGTVVEIDKMKVLRALNSFEYGNKVVKPFLDSIIETAKKKVEEYGYYDGEKYFIFHKVKD